ncbi:MAG: hypothetical protein KF708_12200 [Pirellulales bacterium]|nr:hypothetical protein [Pirellulales bacterium]
MTRFPRPARVVARLEHFASLLGWHDLRSRNHLFDDWTRVVWYESGHATGGRQYFALQINEHPIGSTDCFAAAVHCLKYRICSGVHSFPCRTLREAQSEAKRLHTWLYHAWFATPAARRDYRIAHPECAEYSWRKLREQGKPHYPTI